MKIEMDLKNSMLMKGMANRNTHLWRARIEPLINALNLLIYITIHIGSVKLKLFSN